MTGDGDGVGLVIVEGAKLGYKEECDLLSPDFSPWKR